MTEKKIRQAIDAISTQMTSLYDQECRAIDRVKNRYRKLRGALKEEAKAIQEQCQHAKTYYTPDPCGGHDSSLDCAICEKNLR